MKLSKMKVGTRLGLGFALVLVLLTVIGALGISRMAQIQTRLDGIVEDNVVKMALAQEISESIHIISTATRDMILVNEPSEITTQLDRIENARAGYAKAFEALVKVPAGEDGRAIQKRITDSMLAARPLSQNALLLARDNRDVEATAIVLSAVAPAIQKVQDTLAEYRQRQSERNLADARAATAAYETARVLMLVLGTVAILIGVGAAAVISRGLLKQLGGEPEYAAQIAASIAAGNLAVRVDTREGDRSSMLFAMKSMRDSLATIVRRVRAGTDTIASASIQIAAGNQDLSARTEQQAGSLEETASSMEELTGTVKQNADNARQANGLAESASAVAVKGGAVVGQVVDTMAQINQSSSRISDIIGVIDGIAFQTNILALNAAVEAARAGEQGRGFAVVAAEVRNLAQRSAGAAKEIKDLIGDSVEKVNAGTVLVEQAGATMDEIVVSVRRVTDIIGEITAASHEQTAGIEQINQAIGQMDNVTQQNASLVEEAASASESMQEQAAALAQVVSVFTLDENQGHGVDSVELNLAQPAFAGRVAGSAVKDTRRVLSVNRLA
jgi:methyl-accepting chemotaxis protein